MRHVPNDPVFSPDEYENKLLLHKPRFQDGIEAIRQKWGVPKEGFLSERAYITWQNQLALNGLVEYEEDIRLLIRELGLTERWLHAFSSYVQTNAPSVLKVRYSGSLREDYYDDGKTIRSVWIEVDRDTTQQEMIESFKAAQNLLDVPRDKKQKPKNLDRDLKVLEMHNDGASNQSIANWLNENEDGAFNTDDVAKIIRRIQQRVE